MGQFCDPYVGGTELEGGDVASSFAVHAYLIQRLVRPPGQNALSQFTGEDLIKLSCVGAVLADAAKQW